MTNFQPDLQRLSEMFDPVVKVIEFCDFPLSIPPMRRTHNVGGFHKHELIMAATSDEIFRP
jgi:hypothetical protein